METMRILARSGSNLVADITMLINKDRVFKTFHEKNALQRYLARHVLFDVAQWFGFHVVGDHFHELYPNTRQLARDYKTGPRPLPGIDLRLAECEARALRILELYGPEYAQAMGRFGYVEDNTYFLGLDALLLYVVLRDLKPAKMVEIGQGFSTRIALAALERNAADTGTRPLFLSVDPYPRFVAKDVPASISLEVIEKPLQAVSPQALLQDCGFFFVDSSHVYKPGSDVEQEFTAIYPALPRGVVVHLHDIFTPFDYPRSWSLDLKRFWNEQYFLETFLMFNSAFEVYLPLHLLWAQSEPVRKMAPRMKLDPRYHNYAQSFYMLRV
jgi:hypothetical protein